MEVAVADVSSLVRGWLTSPCKASSKPLPLYQPISPRPERLGLGADLPVIKSQSRIMTASKPWQSVNRRRKPCLPSKRDPELEDMIAVPPASRFDESSSDDDNSCSRSAATFRAKRKHPPTSFSTEMAHSRKKRKQRKKNRTDEQTVNGDKGNRESVHIMSQPKLPASDVRTSTCTAVLDSHSKTHSTIDDSSRAGGTFQLFVRVGGLCSDEEEAACVLEDGRQKLKHSHSEINPLKKRRQALRGGSAHCCQKRISKRPLKKELCEMKQHPSTELSNSYTSSTSIGALPSNNVIKQAALYEGVDDGKELGHSPTPTIDYNGGMEIAHNEACKTKKEDSMEHGRHRRRVMRYRKRTRISQTSSLIKRLYLRKF